MQKNATNAFLKAIVPHEYTLCIARERSFPNLGRPKLSWRHQFISARAEKARDSSLNYALSADNRDTNVYFAVAGYDDAQRRKTENIKGIKTLLLDVDIGKGNGFFASKNEVIPALSILHKAVPTLPSPWVIDSGNGIHIYYVLAETLTLKQWGPISSLFADVVRAIAPKLIADPVRTRDAASVMRLPGSYNAKQAKRLPVSVVHKGSEGKVDAVRAGLARVASGLSLSGIGRLVGKELVPNLPSLPGYMFDVGIDIPFGGGLEAPLQREFKDLNLRPILAGCRQMLEATEARGDIPEPQWVNFLRVLNTVKNPDATAVFFSSGHPLASESSTRRKMRHIRANFSTATAGCKEFKTLKASSCFGCPNASLVWTPSQLGVLDAQRKEIKAAKDEAAESAVRGEKVISRYIAQPTTIKQARFGVREAPVTSMPVRQPGKSGRYAMEPLLHGHINLLFSSAMLQSKASQGVDVNSFDDVRVHMDVINDGGTNRVVCGTADMTHTGFDTATAVLRSKGLIFECGSASKKVAIGDYLRVLAKLANSRRIYYRPVKGWWKINELGSYCFVAGSRTYHPDGKVERNVTSAEHRGLDKTNNGFMERACTGVPRGTLAYWQRGMEIYNGSQNETAQLLLLSGLSNLLLPLLSSDKGGIVLSLVGVSGRGKTTLLKFMASFMGAHDSYTVPGSSTENAIGMLLQQANCMMLNVDDNVAKDGEMFSHLLTMVAGGAGKMRMMWDAKTGGSVPYDDGYYTSMLLTSNFSLSSSIGSGDTKGQMQVEAARSRTLEFPADAIRVRTSDKPLWDRATKLVSNNHGHAVDAFLRHVVTNQVAVSRKLADIEREIFDRLKQQMSHDKAGQVRFWARFLAVTAVTAQIICNKLNLLTWNPGNILATGEALVTDTVCHALRLDDDLVEAFWAVCTREEYPNNPRINFVTRRALSTTWPKHPMKLEQRKARWGRSTWSDSTSLRVNALLPSCAQSNRWRVDTIDVYNDDGKLLHRERSVLIPLTELKELVHKQAGKTLHASDWSDLYIMLRSAGCAVYGVQENMPDRLAHPPSRVSIGINRSNSRGFSRSIVEIRLPIQYLD